MDILSLSRAYVDATGVEREATFASLLSRYPRTLVYFYPRDATPGCTLESRDFTRLSAEFASLGIGLLGVSRDSAASHADFATSCSLGVDLVSDPDEVLHRHFGVIGEKLNYGKTIVGVIRSTFLVDTHARVLQEWRNIKATGHADRLLKILKASA